MRLKAVLLTLVCLFTPNNYAQTAAPTALQQFEVATIKPVDMTPGARHTFGVKVSAGGRVRITNFSLNDLVCTAFDIRGWQLKGGDAWMEKEKYDVEGKAAETTSRAGYNLRYSYFAISDERLRQMLQALLIDRFQLKFHRDRATGQVLLLERSGKPVAMMPSKEAYVESYGEGYSGDIAFAGNRWVMYNTSMPQFAAYISNNFSQKAVVDHTGLEGAFDFRLTVVAADPNNGGSFMDTVHTSFPLFVEAAGLKLTKAMGRVETFVIDHAEPPSAN